MNVTSHPVVIADLIVRPTPPPILRNGEGPGLAPMVFGTIAVISAVVLWRMHRRRVLIEARASSASVSAPAPGPAPAPGEPK